MESERKESKCSVGDILCQMQVLSHLRGMQSAFGDEEFKSKFPEFDGWDKKIVDTIARQEVDVNAALKSCGLSSAEELKTITVQPASITKEETEE